MSQPSKTFGFTLIELMVAIGILSILGWALVQLLSSGMSTWETGEVRRGAYERAQFIFDRLARDLATLYPRNPPMPDAWAFQVDTLHSADYDGTGNDAVSFKLENILRLGEEEAAHLQAWNASEEAWVEYQFSLPSVVQSAVVQPKIALRRSAGCAATCELIVEVSKDAGAFTKLATFTGGLRDQTITPNIDISPAVSGGRDVTVRLRIVPKGEAGPEIRLFEAAKDDPIRPVFRFAASPRKCLTGTDLVSDYHEDGSQFITFVRSSRGLQEVAYSVQDGALYRKWREFGTGASWQGAPLAEGIVYFGCEFQNQYRRGGEDEEKRRQDAVQAYWLEADSVPPYVTVVVSTVPLSGARQYTNLAAGISASDETVPVDSTRLFVLGSSRRQFIKIGREWISYAGYDRRRFTGCARGQRGTLPAPHSKGAEVVAAETFRVNIPIPTWGYRNR